MLKQREYEIDMSKPEGVLTYIFGIYGYEVLKETELAVSLFEKYAPSLKREVLFLRIVLESGVYSELLQVDPLNSTQKYKTMQRVIDKLTEEHFLNHEWVEQSVYWLLKSLWADIDGKTVCVGNRGKSDIAVRLFLEAEEAYRAKSYKKASDLYREGAKEGHIGAWCGLGRCYYYGIGVGKDYDEAVKCFEKAAAGNSAEAQCYLATCYFHGTGVEQDNGKAVALFKKAAENGHAEAQCCLAKCYNSGIGVSENALETIKWLHQSAEQGCTEAQYKLGDCYSSGYGVAVDTEEAARWYQKAMEGGVDCSTMM